MLQNQTDGSLSGCSPPSGCLDTIENVVKIAVCKIPSLIAFIGTYYEQGGHVLLWPLTPTRHLPPHFHLFSSSVWYQQPHSKPREWSFPQCELKSSSSHRAQCTQLLPPDWPISDLCSNWWFLLIKRLLLSVDLEGIRNRKALPQHAHNDIFSTFQGILPPKFYSDCIFQTPSFTDIHLL